jgi:hypothetical protein
VRSFDEAGLAVVEEARSPLSIRAGSKLIGLRVSGKATRYCLKATGDALCEFRAALSLRHQSKIAGRLQNDLLCIRGRKNALLTKSKSRLIARDSVSATAIADGCLVQSWPETDIN